MALAAVCAVLAVVAVTAATTATVLLDGALRARTLDLRLGTGLVAVGTVLGALAGTDLARAVAAAPDGGPAGLAAVGAAALAVLLLGVGVRGAARPGTTALLAVVALVASVPEGLALVVLPAVAGPAAAAAAALVVVVALAWALRHATPEPVHRRSRVLAVLSTTFLAVGAGAQVGQVGAGLVLHVTGGAPLDPDPAGALPAWPRLLVAAVVGLAVVWALLRPRPAGRALLRREPPAVLVADSCAAAVLLLAAAAGLPVPVLLVVLAARAGGDLPRGLRAVEWASPLRR